MSISRHPSSVFIVHSSVYGAWTFRSGLPGTPPSGVFGSFLYCSQNVFRLLVIILFVRSFRYLFFGAPPTPPTLRVPAFACGGDSPMATVTFVFNRAVIVSLWWYYLEIWPHCLPRHTFERLFRAPCRVAALLRFRAILELLLTIVSCVGYAGPRFISK